jgi:arylsulfatase A-like enzyme
LIKTSTKINHRGQSLIHLFSNTENDERVVMLDGAADESQAQYSNTIGLRTKKYKYFRNRFSKSKNVHLYDLENDPLELSNIREQNPGVIENLEQELSQISPTGSFVFKKTHELSDEENKHIEKELRKLGYI